MQHFNHKAGYDPSDSGVDECDFVQDEYEPEPYSSEFEEESYESY